MNKDVFNSKTTPPPHGQGSKRRVALLMDNSFALAIMAAALAHVDAALAHVDVALALMDAAPPLLDNA